MVAPALGFRTKNSQQHPLDHFTQGCDHRIWHSRPGKEGKNGQKSYLTRWHVQRELLIPRGRHRLLDHTVQRVDWLVSPYRNMQSHLHRKCGKSQVSLITGFVPGLKALLIEGTLHNAIRIRSACQGVTRGQLEPKNECLNKQNQIQRNCPSSPSEAKWILAISYLLYPLQLNCVLPRLQRGNQVSYRLNKEWQVWACVYVILRPFSAHLTLTTLPH